MDKTQQIQLLLKHAFFQGLSPIEMKALFSAGEVRAYSEGQVLFHQNQESNGLIFVMSGIFHVHLEGRELPLATVKAGEVIGEVGLLARGKRSATVSAQTEAFVWHLSLEVFEGLIKRGDSIVDGLLKGMGDDLCRRFREGVYEAASIMGELAPKTAARLTEDDFQRTQQ